MFQIENDSVNNETRDWISIASNAVGYRVKLVF